MRLARLIVDQGWPVAQDARRFEVSWRTAKRWAQRYAQAGPDPMTDRSSPDALGRTRSLVDGALGIRKAAATSAGSRA